jgi:hypothetical protein
MPARSDAVMPPRLKQNMRIRLREPVNTGRCGCGQAEDNGAEPAISAFDQHVLSQPSPVNHAA